MKVYLVHQCNVDDFKEKAKKGWKVEELEIAIKQTSVWVLKNKKDAIEDCRRWNKRHLKEYKQVQYFTEIKMYE